MCVCICVHACLYFILPCNMHVYFVYVVYSCALHSFFLLLRLYLHTCMLMYIDGYNRPCSWYRLCSPLSTTLTSSRSPRPHTCYRRTYHTEILENRYRYRAGNRKIKPGGTRYISVVCLWYVLYTYIWLYDIVYDV